jgi:hypothetical protein
MMGSIVAGSGCPQSLQAPPPGITATGQFLLVWLEVAIVAVAFLVSYYLNIRSLAVHRGRVALIHFLSGGCILIGFVMLFGIVPAWSRSVDDWYGKTLMHLVIQGCPTAPATSAVNSATQVLDGLMVFALLCMGIGSILAFIRTALLRAAETAEGHGH